MPPATRHPRNAESAPAIPRLATQATPSLALPGGPGLALPPGSRRALLALPALALLLAAGCGGDETKSAAAPPAERVFQVDTKVVETRDVEITVDVVGTAYASARVELRPQVSGTLIEVRAAEGDRVQTGDVIARLDDSKARASLALAEAQLDSARARLAVASERVDRYRRLKSEDLVSREEFATLDAEQKAAAAAVRESDAQVALARRNLDDFTLFSPIDGRMGIRRLDAGNYIESGTVLCTLVRTDPLEVVAGIPGAEVADLRVGQEAVLRDTRGTEIARGELRVIDPVVDLATRLVDVKIVVPNDEDLLKPGQFVAVSLLRRVQRDAIVIPEEAIVPTAGKTWVFVLRDGVAERREVSLGARLPGLVEATSGVGAGDVLIVRGQHRLADGSLAVDPAVAPKERG